MEHDHIKVLFKETNTSLEKSLIDLESDKLIDMEYFDKMVQKLCLAIQGLPKQEAIQYETPLMKLAKDLASLSEELDRKREELKKQIQNIGHHKKAHSSYKNQN